VGAFKLVHICPDEKFMDGAHHTFELAFPAQNTFVVLKSPANPPIKFIRTIPAVIEVVQNKETLSRLEHLSREADLVVLHGINYYTAKLVRKSQEPEKFLWMILGAELYQNPYIYHENLLGEQTQKLKEKLEKKLSLKEKFKGIYRKLRYQGPEIKEEKKLWQVKESLAKVNFFGSLFPEELDMLKKNDILAPETHFQHFSFYPIEYFTGGDVENLVSGKNILLGNSASYTNNHLEAFNILSSLDLKGREVITPLSYGNPVYSKEIIKQGSSILKSNFEPLIEFLPLEAYNQVLWSCGVVVMNHYRQQGVGNILASLWMGCKVYLSERNLVLGYLKRIGCNVYSIESELRPENYQALKGLTVEQIAANRAVLKENISENSLVKHLQEGISNYIAQNVII
jgi:dTDP-N-acetylfucosamine:lipid II N-acetylfucosaminyltransferase